MGKDSDTALREFVAGRFPDLRRSAYLMCGDWSLAGEMAEISLARLVAETHREPVEDPEAYAYSHLMASFPRRRPPRREHVFVAVDDAAVDPGDQMRDVLVLDALHKLAPRCRAVLVLRHWNGFAVDETADMLGLADERVEAYEEAGLAALERLLSDEATDATTDVSEKADEPGEDDDKANR